MRNDDVIGFIIKSNVRGEEYWEGKGFCPHTVKQYFAIEDCWDALQAYWLNDFVENDTRDLIIKTISTKQLERMLAKGINVQ